MNGESVLDSILDINGAYLALEQRLLQADRLKGMSRLGLSQELANVLAGLSTTQTQKLAACGQLLCFGRLNDRVVLSMLAVASARLNSGSLASDAPPNEQV
ncbi:hypothetical protein GWC77_23575 [Paraburkholderia sp. NMBU_R16]|uniref:flagellar transcriptional regulator FlhD n=1 Tax=Paraburkholderia sp. NMBU_R16 TaxID=2698676 RepID=UPI001563EF73|nr:flagellar transcriptional regulator FlhD [Paraburkholderia sp. NMBU_R16]NRO98892.1 hypothetical protein [Paraburkholderia sp. NMBU_R16]